MSATTNSSWNAIWKPIVRTPIDQIHQDNQDVGRNHPLLQGTNALTKGVLKVTIQKLT